MKQSHALWMLSASVRLYRMMLLSYPPAFRDMFAREMTQAFVDCSRQTLRERGAWGLLSLWGFTLCDLVTTSTLERVTALNTSVKSLLGLTATGLLAAEGRMFMVTMTIAQQTDIGRQRKVNEDSMLSYEPEDPQVLARKGALFVVSDGLGGHTGGEVASELAIRTIRDAYYQGRDEDIASSLRKAIQQANTVIAEQAEQNPAWSGMGTTCAAAVLRDETLFVANVGDSRVYIVHGDTILQITEDHSVVAREMREGKLTPEEARNHPQRNVIYRCLGDQAGVEVDTFTEQVQDGDLLVLCTDGLSSQVDDNELLSVVQQYTPVESVRRLVERANENGGADNITAIVVRVELEKPAA